MTIAKVFCTQMHKTLKCISTMQLFAGMDESANVILDARSKRAYVAHLEKGVVVGKTQILEVDQLEDFLIFLLLANHSSHPIHRLLQDF